MDICLIFHCTCSTLLFLDSPRSPAIPTHDVSSSVGSPGTSIKQEVKPDIKSEISDDVMPQKKLSAEELEQLETQLLLALDDVNLEVPCSAEYLVKIVTKSSEGLHAPVSAVEDLLQKFSAQALIV